MKILVLRVINGLRHRNCFVRGYIHSLFVSKALTRSYIARSGFHTNNSWIYNPVRRTFYDVNYIYFALHTSTKSGQYITYLFMPLSLKKIFRWESSFFASGLSLKMDGIASSFKYFRNFFNRERKSISKQLGKKWSLQA